MNRDSVLPTVWEASKAVDEARAQFVKADGIASQASRDRASALNVLNEAQATFDKVVAHEKGRAPAGSDWNKPNGLPVK